MEIRSDPQAGAALEILVELFVRWAWMVRAKVLDLGSSVKTKLRISECLIPSWSGAPQNHWDAAAGLKVEAVVGVELDPEVATFVKVGSEVDFWRRHCHFFGQSLLVC